MSDKPLSVDYNSEESVHDAVDRIMSHGYTLDRNGNLETKGKPVANASGTTSKSSVIVNDEAIAQGATFDDETVKATGREPLGSIKNIVDAQGNTSVIRKQKNGRWAPVNSSSDTFDQDLDSSEEKGYTGSMDAEKAEKVAVVSEYNNLIPLADKYLDFGLNVLLVGLHGTGKTASIQNLAASRGLKMKYYSCSTLDPFTDLVGVPTPVMYCDKCDEDFDSRVEHRDLAPKCDGKLDRQLRMVRPRDVDEAELIFFDEFNRADPKVQNAVFEMIQFGSINGEKLPHLKACWAAINPPDDEQNYQVEPIDPALMDRFDVYIKITPKPSVSYMSKFMPAPIAQALKVWWDDHQNAIRLKTKDAHSDYISPRRLEKIGLVWGATRNPKSVEASLPMGGNFEKKKLIDSLKLAQKQADIAAGIIDGDPVYEEEDDLGGAGLGDRPNPEFTYRLANMRIQQNDLADWLKNNPGHEATHNKVIEQLRQGVGGDELVVKYPKILNSLNPSKLEGLIAGFPVPKRNQMRAGFMRISGESYYSELTALHKALTQADAKMPSGWPTTL